MKPIPTRAAAVALALATAGLAGGCALSSDPNQGGLFWSETGSRQRLSERERILQGIRSDTAATEAESARLRSKIRAAE
jgi:hypothetical protein